MTVHCGEKMMKMTLLLFVCLIAAIHPLDAHLGDRTYFIAELSDADLASIDLDDGDIGDWQEILGEPTLTADDFIGYGEPDIASFNFHIWMGWHDATDRIYVAMEQVDDFYYNHFDRTDFTTPNFFLTGHDGFLSLDVDGDHSGGQYKYTGPGENETEEWALLYGQGAQGYTALGQVFDGGTHISTSVTELLSQFSYDLGYADWFAWPPYAEGGGGARGEAPSVAVTEFYVTPFDRLVWNSSEESQVSDLFPGKIIGGKIAITDRDEDGIFSSAYSLVPFATADNFELALTADAFADFLLLGADGTVPGDTAVEGRTWARIKASFRADLSTAEKK
jgi:hypothetical protein